MIFTLVLFIFKHYFKNIPLPLAPQKEKKWTIHECMLTLSIGCMKFLFPKLFVTIFGLG